MQRLFFHNPHDKVSREMLAALPEDVQVITMFQQDTVLPFPVRAAPLLVDKQLILLTQPPYYTGGFVLQFQCADHLDNAIPDSSLFYITVNGDTCSEEAEEGILSLTLQADEALQVDIKLEAEGYMPWEGVISIEANPG